MRRRRRVHGVANLTTVETYLHLWEAEIARGLLQSEGIAARLADENIVRMNWSNALAVGGIRLMVPSDLVDAAKAALEREQQLPAAICANCGSRALRSRHSAWWVLLLLLSCGFALVIFPPPRRGLRCASCGHAQRDVLDVR
jgi:DNA-directed RNA polymerase subunit RPC12/RpoP